ncbi:MAG: SIMPL domain-containing protein [Alphaproteobacteria bacterium]
MSEQDKKISGTCGSDHRCCRGMGILLAVLILGGGLSYIGYSIKMTPTANPKHDRFVEVKTSVEQEVKADAVIWRIPFQNTGNDLKIIHEKFVKDRDTIVAFLKDKGFKEEEISIGAPRITDQFVRKEYGDNNGNSTVRDDTRYVVYSRVKLTTENVNGVIASEKDLDQLVKKDIMIPNEGSLHEANPKYFLHDTLKIEQGVMDEALNKAKELAKQVAENMGVKLGELRFIKQDQAVQILGQNHEEYGQRLKGPIKVAKISGKFTFNIH